ncbi:SDR family NAD(P)-dependent oxidoreductase [Dyadobacter alkalitolerans]|uniref:SDR family NAD(P)-dependent oxidoreductase n=1 Tax=Dyadobacter alkalitolerans TaxID=492736 RepID=UPI0003FF3819|nr:SDR family NAD(P)-dependent oxidoreductase [Dyadobacter alkalitolerans]
MENILITGGIGNLGKTVVQTLAEGGYHLHLAVRKDVENSAGNVSFYPTDLADSEQADAFVQKVLAENTKIKAGVFLAGGFQPGNLAETSMDDITKMVNLNFATAFNVAHKLIAHFKTVGGGKLIFVGSKAAMDFKNAGSNFAYSLSKQLLYNFSDLINQSEANAGITSHILLPGTIDTVTNREAMPNADFSQWTIPAAIARTIQDILSGKESNAEIEF